MDSYILVVFRSRMQTMDFIHRCQSIGIYATSMSTPRQINIGCGLSAKVHESYYNKVIMLLKYNRYSAFVGIYKMTYNIPKRIY